MWWFEMRERRRLLRLASALAVAGLLAGCFQPLYGDRSPSGGPSIKAALSGVDVSQISAPSGTAESRLAVETRNALVFGLSGGSGQTAPTHRLNIRLSSSRVSVIVDIGSSRPDLENFGLTATYDLIDLKTGKTVIADQTFARVSYDIPGGEQRFARARGLRDAENRAAQEIAEHIRNRLASYFVAGT
jgi:LPS-assembly lipoprotein